MSLPLPTTTGWSNFYGDTPNSYQLQYARSSQMQRVANAINGRGFRAVRDLMRALNGVAPGASVVDTQPRVQAPMPFNTAQFGGQRVIETPQIVNRVTTAADRDAINKLVYDVYTLPPLAVDLSGNGGGGRLGR